LEKKLREIKKRNKKWERNCRKGKKEVGKRGEKKRREKN